ncbi:MAG: GGDEF domain-containing protein [Eubacterium sp.]
MKFKTFPKYRLFLPLIILFLIVGGSIVYFEYNWMTQFQYDTMGQNALNLAQIAANSLKITNDELENLEDLTFEETLTHPSNIALTNLFKFSQKDVTIKYAYIIRALPQDSIKYTVTEDDADFFDHPIGTPLDYIWLLDVIVNDNEQTDVNNTPDYYADKHRYTSAEENVRALDLAQKSGYTLWEDEWGSQIAGLAPIYTTEGQYIGLVGVDIYSTDFNAYRSKIIWMIVILLLFPAIILTAMYIHYHLSYRDKMRSLAYEDTLSKLFNRRYFNEKSLKLFEQASREQQNFVIIISDIDNFKNFNDCFGHQEGDTAIHRVAELFKRACIGINGFPSRYGGEEFVITGLMEHPEALAEQLRLEIESMNIRLENGQNQSITMSFGICSGIPSDDDTLDHYIHNADKALYKAKSLGKNTCVVSTDDE